MNCMDCGGPCASRAKRCRHCTNIAQRPSFHCEWCGDPFWRKRMPGDARRFCSKRCSGLFRTAAGKQWWQTPEAQIEQAVRREEAARRYADIARQRQESWEAQQPRCSCGAPWTKRRWRPGWGQVRYWCDACFARKFYEWPHLCPNCGKEFQDQYRTVYCSPTCASQMRKMVARGRYPAIGRFVLEERNTLAEYIHLTRAANQRLYTNPVLSTT